MKQAQRGRDAGFLQRHSLGIISSSILGAWIVLYHFSHYNSHWGSLCGNAIADWTGLVVMVFATKHLYESGSEESKRPPSGNFAAGLKWLQRHSLTIFLLVTSVAWIMLFIESDPQARWGTVYSNLVSEWTQILGLIWLSKRFREARSEESKR